MPKKIKYESFKYRFLMAAHELSFYPSHWQNPSWKMFLASLNFVYRDGAVHVSWGAEMHQQIEFSLSNPRFYVRGDTVSVVIKQIEEGMMDREDPVKLSNDVFFLRIGDSSCSMCRIPN